MKLSPLQKLGARFYISGIKKDNEVALRLSKVLSQGDVTVALASRGSGKLLDIIVDVKGRWMHSAFGVPATLEAVQAAIAEASANHLRLFSAQEEAA